MARAVVLESCCLIMLIVLQEAHADCPAGRTH